MNPKTKAVSGKPPKKKKQQSPAKKFIFTVLKILLIFFIVLGCAVTGIVGGAIYGYIKTAEPISVDALQLKNLTSFVYDANGNEIAPLKGLQNRILVSHNEIPDNLRNAFVSIEDERFYSHHGVDIKRTLTAAFSYVARMGNATHGGSTITQQLVKNITGATENKPQRKIQEWYQAFELERNLTKEQILDLYMNLIYMGENYYGVESASQGYFGKNVKDLSLAECAVLAGITNRPGYYYPFSEQGRQHIKDRQKDILNKMLELGKISQQQYDQAIKQDLKYVAVSESGPKRTATQSYFVDQVIIDVINDLKAKGWSTDLANNAIYNGGLKIYTTQDTEIQKVMDEVFINEKNFPLIPGRAEHGQAAMVIVDPYNGQVKAMYGGYGPKNADMIRNRATQMQRQPGSSFKPIAVYGPAIDLKLITPATIIDDAPVYMDTQNKGKAYPVNYESGSYEGLITIHDAIMRSQNVVAARVWKDILGPDNSLNYLKKVGIDRSKERYVSLALGGLEVGVSPLQMAAAYTPFVNKGMYSEPITYTKVLDRTGKVLLEKKSKSNIVYSEAAAYVMTSMMEGVTQAGTAYPYGLLQKGSMPTAGKTGTTSNFIDKWFVGFSPYYIGAVWYGYDNKGGTPTRLQSAEYNQALSLWHLVMEGAHKNLKPKPFTESKDVVYKDVCIYSGKPPSELCAQDPRSGERNPIREAEVFIKGTEPKEGDVCDVHVKAKVCTESKGTGERTLLAGPYCPPQSVIERVFIQRKTPYIPQQPSETPPKDWAYELPTGECTVHGTPGAKTPSNGISDIVDEINKFLTGSPPPQPFSSPTPTPSPTAKPNTQR